MLESPKTWWLILAATLLALGSEALIAFLPQSSGLLGQDLYFFLLSCLFIVVAYMAYRSNNKQRHTTSFSGTVPVVPTWIPWLGHALSYHYDGIQFIRNCSDRYGPVFKFLAAGRQIVAISHPNAIHEFLQDRNHSFAIVEFQFLHRLGGIKNLKRLAVIYPLGPDKALLSLRSPLAPRNLSGITNVYNAKLFQILESLMLPSQSRITVFIKDLVDRNLFNCAVLALMGENFARVWKFEDYETFDQGVRDVLGGIYLPYGKGWEAHTARERQVDVMLKFLKKHFHEGHIEGAEDSPMSLVLRIMYESGANDEEVSRIQTAFMWGAVTNILLVCKWVFYYLLADPDILQKIQNEVRDYISEKFENDLTLLLQSHPQSFGSRDTFPLLNSVIRETLRVTALPTSGRVATRDVDIRVDESTVIPIKKGEIVLANVLSMHQSTDNFQESDKFRADRFVDDRNRKVLVPFGAGSHKCPGEHYGLHTIRMFFAILLHLYDVSPGCDTSIPKIDPTNFLSVIRTEEDREIILERRALA